MIDAWSIAWVSVVVVQAYIHFVALPRQRKRLEEDRLMEEEIRKNMEQIGVCNASTYQRSSYSSKECITSLADSSIDNEATTTTTTRLILMVSHPAPALLTSPQRPPLLEILSEQTDFPIPARTKTSTLSMMARKSLASSFSSTTTLPLLLIFTPRNPSDRLAEALAPSRKIQTHATGVVVPEVLSSPRYSLCHRRAVGLQRRGS